MSCFIMEPDAIAAIASVTASLLNVGFNYFGFSATSAMYAAFDDCKTKSGEFDEQKIYVSLYRLNEKAYCGRYNSPAEIEPPRPRKYAHIHHIREWNNDHYIIDTWHYRLAKLLYCLEYQCSEDATAKDPTLNAIKDFIKVLNCFIVSNADDFINQPWGELE